MPAVKSLPITLKYIVSIVFVLPAVLLVYEYLASDYVSLSAGC